MNVIIICFINMSSIHGTSNSTQFLTDTIELIEFIHNKGPHTTWKTNQFPMFWIATTRNITRITWSRITCTSLPFVIERIVNGAAGYNFSCIPVPWCLTTNASHLRASATMFNLFATLWTWLAIFTNECSGFQCIGHAFMR